MRWKGRRGSENVEDRRMQRTAMKGGGAFMVVLVIIIAVITGGDPAQLLQNVQNAPGGGGGGDAVGLVDPAEDELAQFVSVVLADTEDVWTDLFNAEGKVYNKPKLVLFRERVQSACGFQSAATGPFYCPGDSQVYIDLQFFGEMKNRLGAPGDFAQAYVIAHEVGHHVQHLLGISDQVHRLQQTVGEARKNELSVRLELQADFFAGVWARHAQENWQILEEGDIEEALRAASAIGDDRLQLEARGVVVPESFTHGTSEQRVRWFSRGFRTGDMNQGDTFAVDYREL